MANLSTLFVLAVGVAAVNSLYVGLTPFGYTTTAHSFALPFVGGYRYGFPLAATPFAATYGVGFPATKVLIKPAPILPVAKIAPAILPSVTKVAAGVPFPTPYGVPGPIAAPGFPGPLGPAFPGPVAFGPEGPAFAPPVAPILKK